MSVSPFFLSLLPKLLSFTGSRKSRLRGTDAGDFVVNFCFTAFEGSGVSFGSTYSVTQLLSL